MIPAALLAALALSAGPFDRTASCSTANAPMLSLQAHAALTIGASSQLPSAATLSGGDPSAPNRVPYAGVSALAHGYGFSGGACAAQARPIPLSPAGLQLRGTFVPGQPGVGVANAPVTCALGRRAVVRVRAVVGPDDVPTSGFLAVRSGSKTLRPLVYVAWTPTRVRVFAARSCGG